MIASVSLRYYTAITDNLEKGGTKGPNLYEVREKIPKQNFEGVGRSVDHLRLKETSDEYIMDNLKIILFI